MTPQQSSALIDRLIDGLIVARPEGGVLGLAEAKLIADRAEAYAHKLGLAVCIAVSDAEGRQILFHRMQGSLPASSSLATGKAWTAASYRMGSDEVGRLAQPGAMLFGLSPSATDPVVLFGGGIPCRVAGSVIGAIGISGGTVDEDIAIARHALEAISATMSPAPGEGTGR